jgi:thiol-disulfide isomerase/thioredoxin
MKIKVLRMWIPITLCAMASGVSTESIASTADGPTLRVGDPAPAIEGLTWIKGTPATKYKDGRVYVVDFWASWCAPCNEAMPHLSALQRKYADRLTIVGIDVFEGLGGGEAEVDAVRDFVKRKGEKMAYTVAMDDPNKQTAFHAWVTASGSFGIPAAFIIDQRGKVAWTGHVPSAESYPFDQALKDALAGNTDLARSRAVQSKIVKTGKDAEVMRPIRGAGSRRDYKTAVEEAEKLVRGEPAYAAQVFLEEMAAMLHVDEKEGLAFAQSTSQKAELRKQLNVADDVQFWGLVGCTIAQEKGLSTQTYQAAVGYLTQATSARPDQIWNWVSLAELHHTLGNLDQAIKAQQHAVEVAGKTKDFPADSFADLRRTLAYYKLQNE